MGQNVLMASPQELTSLQHRASGLENWHNGFMLQSPYKLGMKITFSCKDAGNWTRVWGKPEETPKA